MTGRGTAVMLFAALGVAAGVAVTAVGADPPARTVTRQALVDGHAVKWWAARARHNGRKMRRHYDRLEELRHAVRDRLELDGDVAAGLLCIHAHEGAWDDPNAPYYGGLQMDYSFQRTYGREFLDALGTADRWPPFVQVAVGLRAVYSGRGVWAVADRQKGVRAVTGPRFVVLAAYGSSRSAGVCSVGVYDRAYGYREVALFGMGPTPAGGIVGEAERVAEQLNAAHEATL